MHTDELKMGTRINDNQNLIVNSDFSECQYINSSLIHKHSLGHGLKQYIYLDHAF